MTFIIDKAPAPKTYDGMINEFGQVIHGGVINEPSNNTDAESADSTGGDSKPNDDGE